MEVVGAAPAAASHERPEDAPVRWIFSTSGTTSDPKGAQHTDQTVMAAAVSNALAVDLHQEDVNPMLFPFTLVGGPIGRCSSLMMGCVLLLVEAFDPATTIDFMVCEAAGSAPVTSGCSTMTGS